MTNRACPKTDQLRAFVNGSLDEEDAAFLGRHIDTCQDCERLVVRLESHAQSLIKHLKMARVDDPAELPFNDEPELVMAAEQLCDASHPSVSETEDTATVPATRFGPARTEQDAPLSAQIGGYQLLEEIARGGMGVVYRARQVSLNRVVALKMILDGSLASDDDVARFLAEAEAAAKLKHVGIVPVHEIGQHNGRHFFSMDFVDGVSLAKRIAAGPLPPRRAAELLVKVCDAVAYAHAHGVIHRDLKPGNILLQTMLGKWETEKELAEIETHEDCEPKVADFGLAKLVESDSNLTLTGQVMGSPSYMSPEQAAGRTRDVAPATDVYSLGAVLYAMLTGHPPFRAATVVQTIQQVLHSDPVPPRSQNSNIDHDLNTICLKCLSKASDKRYESVAALSDDLSRWLRGEPIRARPVSKPERLRRWVRRYPSVSALIALIVFTTFAGFAAVVWQWTQTRAALVRTQVAERESKFNSYCALIPLSQSQWHSGNELRAKDLLARCPRELRNWEWHVLDRLCHADLSTFRGHAGSVNVARFFPDGRHVISAGRDGKLLVWDTVTGQVKLTLNGHGSEVTCLDVTVDGTRVASGSTDESIRIWDSATGQVVHTLLGSAGAVRAVAFHPNGSQLAAAAGKSVRLWNTVAGESTATLEGHQTEVVDIVFSPDGHRLASIGRDGKLNTWHAASGTRLRDFENPLPDPLALTWLPDGKTIYSANRGRHFYSWDAETGKFDRSFHPLSSGEVTRIVYHAGKGLSAYGIGKNVAIDNTHESSRVVRRFGGHTKQVTSVAFSPDGTRLVSTGEDGSVKVWATDIDRDLPEFALHAAHTQEVTGLTFCPRTDHVATCDNHGNVKVWSGNGELRTQLRLPVPDDRERSPPAWSLAFTPVGKTLAVGSDDGLITFWDLSSQTMIGTLGPHESDVAAISYSRDGKYLAAATADLRAFVINSPAPDASPGAVTIWDVAEKQAVRVLKNHTGPVLDVAFAHNKQVLATASGDKSVRIWNPDTGRQIAVLKGHDDIVRKVAFSTDDQYLASTGDDGKVIVWDVGSSKEVHVINAFAVYGRSVAFTADGSRLAAASISDVKVWDANTGRQLLELRGAGRVLAFSSDGGRLAAIKGVGTVVMWDGTPRTHES